MKGALVVRSLLIFAILSLADPAWPSTVVGGPLPAAERLDP